VTWESLVARLGEMRNADILVGKTEGYIPLIRPSRDKRIILKWIIKK
jgi:hypothetical protein